MNVASKQQLASKPLYDAEVEWLESTGTQYIDTGIIPTVENYISTRIAFIREITTRPVIFGAGVPQSSTGAGFDRPAIGFKRYNDYGVTVAYGGKAQTYTNEALGSAFKDLVISKTSLVYNGNRLTYTRNSFDIDVSVWLFLMNHGNIESLPYRCASRIAYFDISDISV